MMFSYLSKPTDKTLKRGFTLLEVIIAISLLLVGTTATLLLITRTIRQIGIFPSQLIAAHLSQEGIEIVRNIRDTNFLQGGVWDNGLNTANCSTGCEADYTDTAAPDPSLPAYSGGRFLQIDGSGFYSYAAGTDTKFKRKITIVPNILPCGASNVLQVTVETTWAEKGQAHSHISQECLHDWK